MLSKIFTLPILVAQLAMAAPTANTCGSTLYNTNFDNMSTVPPSIFNDLPTPYNGLLWQGFGYTSKAAGAPGIVPHSGSNYGYSNAESTSNAGTPMLTVNYPDSTVKSFSVNSFWFGCGFLTDESLLNSPTACNVQVNGYRGLDNSVNGATQVFSRQFQYLPTTGTGAQQMAFSGDLGATEVNFLVITYSLPGGTAAANPGSGLVIDNVVYNLNGCCC